MISFKDRPYLLLILAVLFWSGNFILGRAFHADILPVTLAFWRWTGAAFLVTWPALPYLRRDRELLCRSWAILLLLSILGIAAFNTLAYTALHYTVAINAILMQSLMPVLIVLMSFILFRERIRRLQGVGILVSLCGAVTIIAHGDLELLLSLSFNHGDLLVFVAVVCYAGYSVMLRKRPNVHPLAFIAVTFWLGAILLLPLFIWETLTHPPLELTPSTLLVIGYVAIFPSIISYLCYNRGVQLVGANRAGLFIHLMPLFGSLMAILFLGESFLWFHLMGMLLIAGGIGLAARRKSE